MTSLSRGLGVYQLAALDEPSRPDTASLVQPTGELSGNLPMAKLLSRHIDFCSQNTLAEYYCDEAKPQQVSLKLYDCINDFGVPCSGGACKFAEGAFE